MIFNAAITLGLSRDFEGGRQVGILNGHRPVRRIAALLVRMRSASVNLMTTL